MVLLALSRFLVVILTVATAAKSADAAAPAASEKIVAEAIENITSLNRPGKAGYATVYDGNKYVQCHRNAERDLLCEAGGALLQPSLAYVLTAERIARLDAFGWQFDPSFGNYARTYPSSLSADDVAGEIIQTLEEGLAADVANLSIMSDWIAREPCPPRNGPKQNLAGLVNDAPSMASVAIRGCVYKQDRGPVIHSAADLIKAHGSRIAAEVQRLRVNVTQQVFFVLNTQMGYVQCQPHSVSASIYCEAVSAESLPILTATLSPDKIKRLHDSGFVDPGRAPNYSRFYQLGAFTDEAIAESLLQVLYDVYGYAGALPPSITTE